ncbi:aminoacyl-tRNA hydrolase [Patescibacteria group bacterium]|nr:aminoacyl-tRNA hydrolase [Patescibacteria group bacterium]
MILIVGLGNPGKKYQKTRHNIGFQVADVLAEKEKWRKSKKANCLYLKKQINNKNVELIKPMTFMNDSGRAVRYAQKKHNIPVEKIIVIHDDIDLPVGAMRISKNSSSAGHKGVQSIINELKTKNFIRFRVGIRPEKDSLLQKYSVEKFVLKNFSRSEQKTIKQAVELTVQAILSALEKGIDKAMSEYN